MLYLNGFFQNAYVTRNLDKAVDALRTEHGIKDFIFFRAGDASRHHFRRRAVLSM